MRMRHIVICGLSGCTIYCSLIHLWHIVLKTDNPNSINVRVLLHELKIYNLNVFPRCLIRGRILGGGGVIELKMCVLISSTTFFSKAFHILRRIEQNKIKNTYRSASAVPLLFSDCTET